MTDKLRDDLTRDLNALRAAASRGPVSSREIFQMTDPMMDRLSRAALAAAPQPMGCGLPCGFDCNGACFDVAAPQPAPDREHDHDMMALANGKLEAERDAAFAAGQAEMRERVVYSVKLTCGLLEGVGYTEFSARVRDLTDCISSLPIKPRP